MIAVVGLQRGSHDHVIEVLDLRTTPPEALADLALPEPSYDFAGLPVQEADVTGDGLDDFLIRVEAGDNSPGVVVSHDGGSWRLVRVREATGTPAVTDVYVARDPSFTGGHLLSTGDDCSPDCARGHITTLTWQYQRAGGYFRSS